MEVLSQLQLVSSQRFRNPWLFICFLFLLDGDADKSQANGKVLVKVEKKFGEQQTVQQYVEMPNNWTSLVQPGSTVSPLVCLFFAIFTGL